MVIKKITVIVILFLALVSCTKEGTEYRLSSIDIPEISGFAFRNEFGDYSGSVGQPNARTKYTDKSGNEYNFLLFPNPCISYFSCYFHGTIPFDSAKIWVVEGVYSGDADYLSGLGIIMNSNNLVAGGAPVFQTETDQERVSIDVSTLEDGYYRVYTKINDIVLWNDIIIDKEFTIN